MATTLLIMKMILTGQVTNGMSRGFFGEYNIKSHRYKLLKLQALSFICCFCPAIRRHPALLLAHHLPDKANICRFSRTRSTGYRDCPPPLTENHCA